MSIESINRGETYSIGGSGVNGLTIGPFHWGAEVNVFGWHSGFKTGEGNRADIVLSRDGSVLASNSDANFDNYNLPVKAFLVLDALSSTSLSIKVDNNMATMNSFGLQATIKRL